MKNIVVHDQYHQSDLKPAAFLEEYIALLHKDMRTLVSSNTLIKVNCPACQSNHVASHFERLGLQYQECEQCMSLYVNPRPSDSQIGLFFKESSAKVFWRQQLVEASQNQRKDKIIKPRLNWLLDSIAEHLPRAQHWVDVHPNQQRYIEAMAQTPLSQKTVIYPYGPFVIPPAISVIQRPWWDLQQEIKADVVTLFEVADHASDVARLMQVVNGMLATGGLCFITTILGSGFDVRELGSQASNIFPPDRLNVLSVKGWKAMVERHGFECLEVSTPGVLDLDIVALELKRNSDIVASGFIKQLVKDSDEETKRSFSEFLQKNLLSSYGRMVIRKV